jgi:glycosyltransferase involved in cell wall biosynthesis
MEKLTPVNITVIAIHKSGLPEIEELTRNCKINRIKLHSSSLPKGKIFGLVRIAEWFFRTLYMVQKSKPNLIQCHSFMAMLPGLIVKIFFRRKVIYDAHEFESETLYLPNWKKPIIRFIEKFMVLASDATFVVGNGIMMNYRYLYGSVHKIHNIPNFPLRVSGIKSHILQEKLNLEKNDFIVLYQGMISRGRGIELILEVAEKFKSSDVHLVFMGYGNLVDNIRKNQKTNKNLHFLEAVPPEDVHLHTSSASVGLCLTENKCRNNYLCMPNKYFEYLNSEIPIITTNLFELSKITEQIGSGLILSDTTADALFKAIKEIKAESKKMKERISKVKNNYNWEENENYLNSIYYRVLFDER